MNQEYRNRVKRFLAAGGDSKYVNVKRKSKARHDSFEKVSSHSKALKAKKK